MTRRILQIIPSLDRAGAEKQMTLLVRGLPRTEFDVHVCALTRGGPLEIDLRKAEIPLTVIGKRWRADPRAFWRLRALTRRLRPDLIHTWLFAANSYGRAAGIACGVKYLVAGERCVDPWKGWMELAVDRRLARHTSRIVANSPGVRDFYVRHGLPAGKFRVIPNGVPSPELADTRLGPPPDAAGTRLGPPLDAADTRRVPSASGHTTRQALLAELGLPRDCRLVGVVGRLWPQKRVKDAIWAADVLKVARDDVHLLVIGDGPHRQRLRRFRDQVEIRDKVHFLGHRDDVPRLMPHFDALWSTSAYEGQSNAILEAMALGVPVVATDVPGTRDLVVHGQTGFLVPADLDTPRRRAAFARHTNRLLDDPEQARRLGEAARRRALGEFSVEKMLERYAELYREVLSY
jgi:glycosyltransferase involved in cell wall biosynthesis